MQAPHKMVAAIVALGTAISLPTAEAGQIPICPPNYGQIEWTNCLGVYYFPDAQSMLENSERTNFTAGDLWCGITRVPVSGSSTEENWKESA